MLYQMIELTQWMVPNPESNESLLGFPHCQRCFQEVIPKSSLFKISEINVCGLWAVTLLNTKKLIVGKIFSSWP
jgi:hypothetical protein